jgi:EpsI family protein
MKRTLMISLVVGASMVAAAGLTRTLTPTISMASTNGRIDLESLIPARFGEWRPDPSATGGIVNPEVTAELSQIYSQTLARTYINASGERIMLSIAYGDNQSRALQVHRPEVCYSAQGFSVSDLNKEVLDTSVAQVPVMRLLTRHGERIEPITYWVLIGHTVVRGNIEQGLARMRYGLSGRIADGLLVRVSTISGNQQQAYAVEQRFIGSLLSALPAEQRVRLIGHTATAQ